MSPAEDQCEMMGTVRTCSAVPCGGSILQIKGKSSKVRKGQGNGGGKTYARNSLHLQLNSHSTPLPRSKKKKVVGKTLS
jgi:hypothetical protein